MRESSSGSALDIAKIPFLICLLLWCSKHVKTPGKWLNHLLSAVDAGLSLQPGDLNTTQQYGEQRRRPAIQSKYQVSISGNRIPSVACP